MVKFFSKKLFISNRPRPHANHSHSHSPSALGYGATVGDSSILLYITPAKESEKVSVVNRGNKFDFVSKCTDFIIRSQVT